MVRALIGPCLLVGLSAGAGMACGEGAVLLAVDGDLVVPDEVDGMCLSIADRDASGGEFARFYALEGELGGLPQTLRVEAGGAAAADARVRGYLHGIEVARAGAAVDFAGDVTLGLDACPGQRDGAAVVAGTAAVADGAVIAASVGRGGTWIVAVAAGAVAVFRAGADGEGLADVSASVTLPEPPVGAAALVAFDADGDCDDDILVVAGAGAPRLWRRDAATALVDVAEALPADVIDARAAVAADVDGDGAIDLLLGGGDTLQLLRNDGTGRFTADDAAISDGGALVDITALAAADLDGDGHVDLVAGQAGAPPRALFNDADGTGFFAVAVAALPEVALDVRAAALVDVDGDGARDLIVALAPAAATPLRVYVNRGGRLEDRSFVVLPALDAADATSIAAADWDDDCAADLAVGVAGDPPLLLRSGGDGFAAETAPALPDGLSGNRTLLADVDDDGARDLVLAGGGRIGWVRR